MIHFVPIFVSDPRAVFIIHRLVELDVLNINMALIFVFLQCFCYFGGGGLHRAGALPELYFGHAGLCLWEVPA